MFLYCSNNFVGTIILYCVMCIAFSIFEGQRLLRAIYGNLTTENLVKHGFQRPQDIYQLKAVTKFFSSRGIHQNLKFEIWPLDQKIRNRFNQVPHLTPDTNGKVTKLKTLLVGGILWGCERQLFNYK